MEQEYLTRIESQAYLKELEQAHSSESHDGHSLRAPLDYRASKKVDQQGRLPALRRGTGISQLT